jgi:hypothetical protein
MDPHYRLPSDPGEMPIKLIFSDKTKLYNYSYIGCMYTYYIFRKKCRHKQPLKLMRKNFFRLKRKIKIRISGERAQTNQNNTPD